MRCFVPLALALAVSACVGGQNPDRVLTLDGTSPVCRANEPPPGYRGPLSPHAGSCAPSSAAFTQPVATFDYSQGSPPHAVAGQGQNPLPP